MDEREFVVLEADLNAQRAAIKRVVALLDQRAQGLSSDNSEKLESVAYQLHNLYNSIEDLLKAKYQRTCPVEIGEVGK